MINVLALLDIYRSNKEMALEDAEGLSDREIHNIAAEWTAEDISRDVQQVLENMWAGQLEATNKAHFG